MDSSTSTNQHSGPIRRGQPGIRFLSHALVLSAAVSVPYLLGNGLTDLRAASGLLAVILMWSLLAAGERAVQPAAPKTVRQEDTRWRKASLLLLWLLLPASAFGARFSPAGLVLGISFMVLGGGLRLWSLHTLGPLFTWTTGITAEHRVVRHGPYRYTAHPNYIGNALFACGIVLATASLYAAVLWLVFVGCIIQTARHEAAYLKCHLSGYP